MKHVGTWTLLVSHRCQFDIVYFMYTYRGLGGGGGVGEREHSAYCVHHTVTSLTGQIFVMYIHCCSRAVCIKFFFFYFSLFLFLDICYIFIDRFYSTLFMKGQLPGNLEGILCEQKIVFTRAYYFSFLFFLFGSALNIYSHIFFWDCRHILIKAGFHFTVAIQFPIWYFSAWNSKFMLGWIFYILFPGFDDIYYNYILADKNCHFWTKVLSYFHPLIGKLNWATYIKSCEINIIRVVVCDFWHDHVVWTFNSAKVRNAKKIPPCLHVMMPRYNGKWLRTGNQGWNKISW
jgi:hypothetical protein